MLLLRMYLYSSCCNKTEVCMHYWLQLLCYLTCS
jgi:hypothetical protein